MSQNSPTQTIPAQGVFDQAAALSAFYANRKLLFRNIFFIIVLTIGWSACMAFVVPLSLLALKAAGVKDSTLGLINGSNQWIYSYLVMYFAWKSDHTVSRFGRRIPYLMISAPIIILTIAVFPLFQVAWVLVFIYMIKAIFMDIKAATIPLLNIDCVPKDILARVGAISHIVVGVINFLAMRYGMKLADHHFGAPFYIGALLLAITTVIGIKYIQEPPIKPEPPKESFKPWSAMKVAWTDKRSIVLMLGVGLIRGVSACNEAWIWLLADQRLDATRGELGSYMSWGTLVPFVFSIPIGCMVDRYRGMRMIVIYWVCAMVAAWWIVTQVHNGLTLTIAALILAFLGPLYAAADIKVYRDADRKDVGSITSTNSCLRGIVLGSVIWGSGMVVERFHGNYAAALILGAIVTTLGFGLIFLHSLLMKFSPKSAQG